MAEEDRKAMVSPSAQETNYQKAWGGGKRTQRKYSRDADGLSDLCCHEPDKDKLKL